MEGKCNISEMGWRTEGLAKEREREKRLGWYIEDRAQGSVGGVARWAAFKIFRFIPFYFSR